MSGLFWTPLIIAIGAWVGWNAAHISVADQCEKLGGFFSEQKIFKCVEVKHVDR